MAFLAKSQFTKSLEHLQKGFFQPIFHPNLENETIKEKKKNFEEMARDALMVDIYIFIYIYMCLWIHNIFVSFICFGIVKSCQIMLFY